MFGKKVNSANYRVHERYSAENMRVVVDGVECTLHDYSDGGVRISARGQTRRVALIEVYKNNKCIRKSPAIVAWRRETQAGYAFRSNLKIYELEDSASVPPAQSQGRDSANTKSNDSVNALRARLRM